MDPSEETKVKFLGKPFFKSKKTYYLAVGAYALFIIGLCVVSYGCYYIWDSPTYIKVIIWILLSVLTLDGIFESYQKYKESFTDQNDESVPNYDL